jgi:hypothetical protein
LKRILGYYLSKKTKMEMDSNLEINFIEPSIDVNSIHSKSTILRPK